MPDLRTWQVPFNCWALQVLFETAWGVFNEKNTAKIF